MVARRRRHHRPAGRRRAPSAPPSALSAPRNLERAGYLQALQLEPGTQPFPNANSGVAGKTRPMRATGGRD